MSNSNNIFLLSRSSQSNNLAGFSQIYEDPDEGKDSQNRMDTIFENEIDEALLSASPSYSKSVSSNFEDDLKSEYKTAKENNKEQISKKKSESNSVKESKIEINASKIEDNLNLTNPSSLRRNSSKFTLNNNEKEEFISKIVENFIEMNKNNEIELPKESKVSK